MVKSPWPKCHLDELVFSSRPPFWLCPGGAVSFPEPRLTLPPQGADAHRLNRGKHQPAKPTSPPPLPPGPDCPLRRRRPHHHPVDRQPDPPPRPPRPPASFPDQPRRGPAPSRGRCCGRHFAARGSSLASCPAAAERRPPPPRRRRR